MGTAHVSRRAAEETRELIMRVRPDTVVIELDPGRDPHRAPNVGVLPLVTVSKRSTSFAGTPKGLTLVHLSAQLERFVWDRGCA